jgi:uncharacterized protein (TIGR00730 family)
VTALPERDALLAAYLRARPLSRQRRELLASLLENVGRLAQADVETLDLKIAESVLSELVEAFEVFAPYRDVRKLTIFGSARTAQGAPLYELAEQFAAAIADEGWMVVTGAGPGIMAAGIEGAGRERSFGVNIQLPFEQGANEFIADDIKLIEMRYFFTRKVMLTKESSAFAIFPGGFGTLDECFELLTLLQTGKGALAPVLLFDTPDGHYWKEWWHFIEDYVVEPGYVSASDDCFFNVVTSAKEGVDVARHFFANYQSMRMVHTKAVIRMRQEPTTEQLTALNDRFAHLLTTGAIAVSDPLPVERSAKDALDCKRLVFEFNRKDYGSLRRLIDEVNSWVVGTAPGPALV